MKTYILAAGAGTRMAPYNEARPKTLLPIVNRPVIEHLAEAIGAVSSGEVRVAARASAADIRRAVPDAWKVVEMASLPPEAQGTAQTLLTVYDNDQTALVLHGDTLVSAGDLNRLATLPAGPGGDQSVRLLLSPIAPDETGIWIGVRCEGDRVTNIVGHPRSGTTHRIAGFSLPPGFRQWLERTPTRFPSVEVGMMPPAERHLEAAVELWRIAGKPVDAVFAQDATYDLDKPWDLLTANRAMLRRTATAMTENRLGFQASVDDTALVQGFISLGRNSRIGRNVIVRGNLIADDDVVIDAGAILNGTAAIGSGTTVANGCFIENGSVIGRNCVVSHGAELDGMIMDGVYLYHYMEIYGIVGENTDIGAATVCGSLRFDDGRTTHRTKGHREVPRDHANATFIGDFCRTGVNAIIMPGCKIGPYSVVGPGVVLEQDLAPRTGVRVKQELAEFRWGPERYGW